jgi:phospholipid transport system transporter-binding protein
MMKELFKPTNDLTFETVQQEGQRFFKLLSDDKTIKIGLELSGVLHCDSAGLAMLIEAKRMCHQYNKPLVIQGMPKAIVALADFCGVKTMLEND